MFSACAALTAVEAPGIGPVDVFGYFLHLTFASHNPLDRLAQKDPSEGLTSAPSASCEPRTRPPNARLSRAGVNKAVAGFIADAGMHEPPPQEAFTD